jgi:hypothetical protein
LLFAAVLYIFAIEFFAVMAFFIWYYLWYILDLFIKFSADIY